MATEITRGAAAATEEAVAAPTPEEDSGGLAGYVAMALGPITPVSVLDPGSGFETTEETVAAPTATEDSAPAQA